jgi:cell wall-associated NlpC family hydrolase
MAAFARRGPAPYVLLVILAALLMASEAVADPIAEKQAEAQAVIAQINQLNVSLDRSNELVNLANLKLTEVRHEIAVNRHELKIAKRNLDRSRITIAQRLVTLYTSGSSSSLDVILGGRTLDEILNRIDTANRVTSVDAQVANQVQRFQTSVLQARAALATEQDQVQRLVAQRAAEKRAIEYRLGERRSLLDSLNAQVAQLVAQRQAAILAAQLQAARAAQQRVAAVQSQATQTYQSTAVGATAVTPEGATVVPPSQYSGVVGVAMSEIGTPYQWAGASPGGFDCSGLVMYAYSKMGVSLPHSSYAMWNDGTAVPKSQLEPGDLVFFNGLGHVGIYIGGGEYVHAPHTGTVVQVSSLDASSDYVGARRVN